MTKTDSTFSVQDVSNGFFHNFITNIAPCSNSQAWVSSRYHEKPEVGRVGLNSHQNTGFVPLHTQRVVIPKVKGAVTSLACGIDNNGFLAGTMNGDLVFYNDNQVTSQYKLDSAITALQSNSNGDAFAGTKSGRIYQIQNGSTRILGDFNGKIFDLVRDIAGNLWASVKGKGLYRFQDEKWELFSPKNSKVAYTDIGSMSADPKGGIWYIAHGESRSYGVGFFDGVQHILYNPPQRIINKPSSLGVDFHGGIWVGTWFGGIYNLVRQ
jgi:ligand-binding sensor domain-containing protein